MGAASLARPLPPPPDLPLPIPVLSSPPAPGPPVPPPPPPPGAPPGEPGSPPDGEIENAPYLFPGGNAIDVPPAKGSVPIINKPFGSPGLASPAPPPLACAEAVKATGAAPGVSARGTGSRGCEVVGATSEVSLTPASVAEA